MGLTRTRLAILLATTSVACARASVLAPVGTSAAITPQDLERRLTAFAADSMMGRAAGSIWDYRATAYVADEFARLGLRPAGENGTFFQVVPNVHPRNPMDRADARNVIAIVPGGDPALHGEYVAITAHNDHVGFSRFGVDHDSLRAFNTVVRPQGADSPVREATPAEARRVREILDSLRRIRPPRRDSIYNGADDDGSGTVALLEIAEAFAKGGAQPRRSILLVSHTAEEEGLIGSSWFTDHPTVPIDSIVAEIDLDMVGRGSARDIEGGGPTYLEVVGLRRLSSEYGDWFEAVNAKEPLPFVFNYEYDAPGHPAQYYCRADHYSYARYGIPSVSLSRGGHMDYHQVTDEPQYIDYPDYARLTSLVFDAALYVANADHAPRLDGPKPTNPHVPCRQ
ncbi:MAG TPA: M28 family peptidase [Gemmatimonadaceae bacterium]|nr:M28 family peptidase [Gemmatimonadaceae bacterium]